jgi:hypothetical protein
MSIQPTKYVLDANVFMEAARRYYAFEIKYCDTFKMLRELGFTF